MLRSRLATALAVAATTAGAAALVGFAATASASVTPDATPLPAHVFAPYFEAYNGDSMADLAAQSGNKYLTMAFLQTASRGSCTPYWNGDTGMPVSSGTFGDDIDTIRAAGGDVVPSFGGYAADNGGTEIADSCTDVDAIAAAYEKVVTTYDITRLDMDVEDNSLTNTAGIDRRNKAIKKVEDWAAGQGRTVQFVYTLPTTTGGLADNGMAVLRNAVDNGARVDIANMMTFDYYDNASHQMADDTESSAAGLHDELAGLYPGKSDAQLWQMIGITEMPGIDDFGAAETFTTADATQVEDWAVAKGIGELSFWALQRDNGGCPGTGGSDGCSGVDQSTWQFSHTFEDFTSGTAAPPTTPPTSEPPTSPPAGTGQIVNGDFESGALAPWSCTADTGAIVSSPAHSGGDSLAVTPTASDPGTCTQTVAVQPNHSYTLTAYVQGDNAYLGTTGAGTDGSTWASGGAWTKLSTTFTSGSASTVHIWVHGWYGTGTIHVDDVALT